jgi:phosphohistidine phosphatase SixA
MIVFVLRHGDRTAADDLNDAGERRALLLSRMLGDSGVGFAFRSQFNRAEKTLKPLKAKLPTLTVKTIKVEDGVEAADYAAKVAEAVKALPQDAVVIVVGHSNTVGPTIESLGGETIETIEEDEFDKLFVLLIPPAGPTTLLKLRYGEPT